MAKATEHIESLISFYLDNELPDEKRKKVERHIGVCESCRRQLDEQRKAAALLNEYRKSRQGHLSTADLLAYHDGQISSNWKQQIIESHLSTCSKCQEVLQAASILDEAELELPAPSPRINTHMPNIIMQFKELFRKNRLVLAAVGLAAVILILVMVLTPNPNPYGNLVQIIPAPYVPSEIRGGEAADNFRAGMRDYQAGVYAGAAQMLQQAAEQAPDNPQFLFFCGVSFLLNEQYVQGVEYLSNKTLIESAYREEALFYAAQGYLKLGNIDQAEEKLHTVADSGGKFSGKAQALLEKMRAVQ